MSEIKEQFIEDSLKPVSIEQTEIILEQMKNCAFKFHIEGKKGTGFFVQVPYDNQIFSINLSLRIDLTRHPGLLL